MGVLEVGAPPQLLLSPSPRLSTPPSASLNDNSGLPPIENESLTSHLFSKSQISGLPPSENGNSRPVSPSQNKDPDSLLPLPSQNENSGPSSRHENDNSNSHLLNPENQPLPSETENLEEEQTVGLVRFTQ